MISVVRMTALEDDVAIDTLVSFTDETHLKDLYKYVKDFAVSRAEEMVLDTQGRTKPLVEMGENGQGLPHASIYINNIIEQQVFATR